jgi:nucleoid DNA-binding protein
MATTTKRTRRVVKKAPTKRAAPKKVVNTTTQAQFDWAFMERLNNSEFFSGIQLQFSRREVREILNALSETMYQELKNNSGARVARAEVTVRGMGKFVVRRTPPRKARMGRNPATGEEIQIAAKPASHKLVAKPNKVALRDRLGVN